MKTFFGQAHNYKCIKSFFVFPKSKSSPQNMTNQYSDHFTFCHWTLRFLIAEGEKFVCSIVFGLDWKMNLLKRQTSELLIVCKRSWIKAKAVTKLLMTHENYASKTLFEDREYVWLWMGVGKKEMCMWKTGSEWKKTSSFFLPKILLL